MYFFLLPDTHRRQIPWRVHNSTQSLLTHRKVAGHNTRYQTVVWRARTESHSRCRTTLPTHAQSAWVTEPLPHDLYLIRSMHTISSTELGKGTNFQTLTLYQRGLAHSSRMATLSALIQCGTRYVYVYNHVVHRKVYYNNTGNKHCLGPMVTVYVEL